MFRTAMAVFLCSAVALAEEPSKDYRAWLDWSESTCAAEPEEKLASPTTWTNGEFTYVVEGARARVTHRAGAGATTKIGVIGALLDDTKETAANVADYLTKFRAEGVRAVIVSGTTGRAGDDIEKNLARIAMLGVPVLAVIGNGESRGEFNLAVRRVHASHRNVLHMGLVRSLQLDGVGVVSQPGFHDDTRLVLSGTCKYRPADLKQLPTLTEGLNGPLLFVGQGTPRFKGKDGLDYLPDSGNIGDTALAKALKTAKIRFGILTTVPEAGTRGADLAGGLVNAGTLVDELFVNPGSANSLPTRLNAGGTSYGSAAIVTFSGTQARYEVLRSKQRVGAIRRVRTE